jgi:ketosteroid isomerase-like protein
MSEERERLVELAREGLAAYERGDIDAVLALLHPEIEVTVSPTLPNPEGGSSHDEFLAWTARWEEAWDSFTSDVLSIELVDDRHVIAHARQRGVGAGSGVEVEMEVFWMFEWDGEKTTRLGLYVSREEAVAGARGEGLES